MVRSIKNLIAAFFISMSLFWAWTDILPKYDRSVEIKSHIKARTTILDSRKKIIDNLLYIQEAYQQRYAELQRLALVVPKKKDLSELLSTLEDIASKTGISLGSLKIGEGGDKEGMPISLLSFETSIKTQYESWLNFLDTLEKNIRLVDLNLLSVSQKPELGEEPSQATVLSIQIKGDVYYLKPWEEYQKSLETSPAFKETQEK